MGSKSRSSTSTSANTENRVDNSITEINDDHSSIDNSYRDSSTTQIITVDKSSKLDAGAVDKAFAFGENIAKDYISGIERTTRASLDQVSHALANNQKNVSETLKSNQAIFFKATDDIAGAYEDAYGEAYEETQDSFESALAFADKKSSSENQLLLEGFQKNTLFLAMIVAGTVVASRFAK